MNFFDVFSHHHQDKYRRKDLMRQTLEQYCVNGRDISMVIVISFYKSTMNLNEEFNLYFLLWKEKRERTKKCLRLRNDK